MTVEDKNMRFKLAMEAWDKDRNDEGAWTEMWLRMEDACRARILARLNGIKIDPEELHEKVMYAVCMCMRRIKYNGDRPRSLIAYVSLPTLEPMYHPRFKFEDRNVSYASDYPGEEDFNAIMEEYGRND